MRIFVKTVGKRMIRIDVNPSDEIDAVKEKIYLKEGLPVQDLTCDGKLLLSYTHSTTFNGHLTSEDLKEGSSILVMLLGMPNLRTLNLSNNRITYVGSLAKLVNLTELNLTGNQITNINSLAELVNLSVLTLDKTVSIPHSIQLCIKLNNLDLNATVVDLSASNIVDLDLTLIVARLSKMSNKFKLILNNNNISAFNYQLLSRLSNLTELELYNNPISRAIRPHTTELQDANIIRALQQVTLYQLQIDIAEQNRVDAYSSVASNLIFSARVTAMQVHCSVYQYRSGSLFGQQQIDNTIYYCFREKIRRSHIVSDVVGALNCSRKNAVVQWMSKTSKRHQLQCWPLEIEFEEANSEAGDVLKFYSSIGQQQFF